MLDESIITLSFVEAIVVESISQPTSEADTVFTKTLDDIDELVVYTADWT